jgi:hypothetical protein
MSLQNVARLRLINQNIVNDGAKTALEVTQHMGAMQAQDYYGSLWALGLRTGLTEKEIITVIVDRKIIRTWPQRGTLHFVPAEDTKWLVSLSAERLLHGARHRQERLDLSDKILVLSKKALTKALQGNQLLTRPQVMEVLEDAGVSTKGGRGYHILWYLSQSGVIYVGPMQAKQQTFGLLDDLVPQPKSYSRQAGIAELARRYFISHGPATLQDFMWWTGLTAADAKGALEANKSSLQSEKIANKDFWMAKNTALGVDNTAFLLPGFDEYMLGYKDRSAALHPDYAQAIIPGGNGMFASTIVLDGQVVGTWKRVLKKDHVQITLAPFQRLAKTDIQKIQAAAERYGHFVGLPPKLLK